MSKSTCSFWCNLFAKVESMLLLVVFKHNDGRPKCTAYEALFFYQILTLHVEMIYSQVIHESDDEYDECLSDLFGTTKNQMRGTCSSVFNLIAERLLKVSSEKGLEYKPSQAKIVKALGWYVETEACVHYKCYNCGLIGIALWIAEDCYRICRKCHHWYLMPIQKNVDYKETMTAAYISGFFEWCGIKAGRAKSVMDLWKLRMENMRIFNEADGDNVSLFSNYIVNSEDSEGYCMCLERFEAGSVVKILPCRHLMHSDCLRDLLIHSDVRALDAEKGPRCPVCRSSLLKVTVPRKSKKKKRLRFA